MAVSVELYLVVSFSTDKVTSIKYISVYLELYQTIVYHQIYFCVFRITSNNCVPSNIFLCI